MPEVSPVEEVLGEEQRQQLEEWRSIAATTDPEMRRIFDSDDYAEVVAVIDDLCSRLAEARPVAGGLREPEAAMVADSTAPLAMPDRIAIDADGYGWRVWDDSDMWSMVPTNPDNSPVPHPVTWFVPETPAPPPAVEPWVTHDEEGRRWRVDGVVTERPCSCTTPPPLIPQDTSADPNCRHCKGSGRLPCEPRLHAARLVPDPVEET